LRSDNADLIGSKDAFVEEYRELEEQLTAANERIRELECGSSSGIGEGMYEPLLTF
jgi:hypothetical protein